MPTELEALLATIREKYEAATKKAALYGEMLRELEAAAHSASVAGPRKARKVKAGKPAAARVKKRATPVRAEISASEAVLRLLSGCKLGLPSAEIVRSVASTYGYRPNTLGTTLYNLKKKGAIVQGEDGAYMHPDHVG